MPVEEPVFPFRAAAIDVGSNAIRFAAVEFRHADARDVLEQIRTPVRLGAESFRTGRLGADTMEAALDALRQYARLLKALDIQASRAVATSAVRESRNGREFVSRVREETGVRLEAITGAEEARLVHLAVRDRFDLGDRKWLLVDLGGGSVETSLVTRENIEWSVSRELGSVRLLEELSVAGDDRPKFRRRLEEYLASVKLPKKVLSAATGMIATGGNIETLAKLGDAPEEDGVARLSLARLQRLIGNLAAMSYEERLEELGLREDRADVIVPAAMVYERICTVGGFDEIVVPGVGVRDGVLLDLLDDATQHVSHGARQEDVVREGAVMLGRRYDFDEEHAQQVTRLALSLFDQLDELHELETEDRRILLAAALLHDIGTFVSYRRHHKHSMYLIAQSELPGFAPEEIGLVANVARYHRKSRPAEHHTEYMALDERARSRVRKLAALLRVADALDREHLQNVEAVRLNVKSDEVRLTVRGTGDLLLEQWAVGRKADLFEETYGRPLAFRFEGED